MDVVLCGGSNTSNIIDSIKAKFTGSGVVFHGLESMEELFSLRSSGIYFDRAIILEKSWITDNEDDNRHILQAFEKDIENKLKDDQELIIVVESEESAELIDDELMTMDNRLLTILHKGNRYSIQFLITLIKEELTSMPSDWVYNTGISFNNSNNLIGNELQLEIDREDYEDEQYETKEDKIESLIDEEDIIGVDDIEEDIEEQEEFEEAEDSLDEFEEDFEEFEEDFEEFEDGLEEQEEAEDNLEETEDSLEDFEDELEDEEEYLEEEEDEGCEYIPDEEETEDSLDDSEDSLDDSDNILDELEDDIEEFEDYIDETEDAIEDEAADDIGCEYIPDEEETEENIEDYIDETEDDIEDEEETVNIEDYIDKEEQGSLPEQRKQVKDKTEKVRETVEIDDSKLRITLSAFASRGTSIVVTGCDGSGTSTVSYNIANNLNRLGYTVLLVDCDTINKAQSYITKQSYDAVNLESKRDSLRAGFNSSGKIALHCDIIDEGLQVMSLNLNSDTIELDSLVSAEKLTSFISSSRNQYNFIVYDIPLRELNNRVGSSILLSSDISILNMACDNSSVMKTLLQVCNLDKDEVRDAIFYRSNILINRVKNIGKLFGKKIKNGVNVLNIMDEEIEKILGFSSDEKFSNLPICGIIQESLEFECGWFNRKQVSDTKLGYRLFLDIIKNVIIR